MTLLGDEPEATLLSAKARAVFPSWPDALVRVVPEVQVSSLNLQPTPGAAGPRLRLVG